VFLQTIGPILRIELLGPNSEIIQGNACARFETEDQLVHSMLAPMSGNVIEQNDPLVEDHSVLEKDPYFQGWIYTMIPSDLEYELKHLTPCGSDKM
jgi:glycine cleavage system H lipoate-binding protein